MSKFSVGSLIAGFSCIIILVMIQLISLNNRISVLESKQSPIVQLPFSVQTPTIQVEQIASSSPTWEEFKAFKRSSQTNIQKKYVWKEKFENKPIKWQGKVVEVSERAHLTMMVSMDKNAPTYPDVLVYLKGSEHSKAFNLNKGDNIIFTGKIDIYETIEDGEIISVQN